MIVIKQAVRHGHAIHRQEDSAAKRPHKGFEDVRSSHLRVLPATRQVIACVSQTQVCEVRWILRPDGYSHINNSRVSQLPLILPYIRQSAQSSSLHYRLQQISLSIADPPVSSNLQCVKRKRKFQAQNVLRKLLFLLRHRSTVADWGAND